MYRIEATPYGFKVTTSGPITLNEVEQLKLELLETLSAHDRPFSLVLDSRKIIPPPPEVMKEFWDIHIKVWLMSCERIAFVVSSPVAKDQVRQMQHKASSVTTDRIIDASRYPDWEKRAIAWVVDAKEPDESPVLSREKSK